MVSYNFNLIVCLTLSLLHVKAQYDDYPNYDEDSYSRPTPPSKTSKRGQRGRDGPDEPKKNEVIVGTKRFKLYEKKRMNFKRATEFCKKKDGRLAEAHTLEEMRRLESLFMRARMIGMDVWVGADKKKWKPHSSKYIGLPGLNLNTSSMEQSGIKAQLMGGGQKEMCPAIGLSTRSMAQVQCIMPLPFICEYDKNKPKTTKKPKQATGKGKTTRKPKEPYSKTRRTTRKPMEPYSKTRRTTRKPRETIPPRRRTTRRPRETTTKANKKKSQGRRRRDEMKR